MYKQLVNSILRIADGAHIPCDTDNSDYASYLKWVAAGNTPLPAPVTDWRTPIMEDFKSRREVYLGRVVGIAWAAEKGGDTIVPDAALAFRAGLLALPDDPAVVAAQSAEELTYAIMAAYKALTASMPTEAKLAFAKVNR